jgi:hypothetical protein
MVALKDGLENEQRGFSISVRRKASDVAAAVSFDRVALNAASQFQLGVGVWVAASWRPHEGLHEVDKEWWVVEVPEAKEVTAFVGRCLTTEAGEE